jgi:hypothetical protein
MSDFLKLRDWLREKNMDAVAMESTGVYWNPTFDILEDSISGCSREPPIPQEISWKK